MPIIFSVHYSDGNVGIGTDAPLAPLDVDGAVHQKSVYSSESDFKTSMETGQRGGTTGVIGTDLHYVDASGNLQETMKVETDVADPTDYTGFNITTNVTQTQQTGWGVGGEGVP